MNSKIISNLFFNLNIERAALSSIIFDPQIYEDVAALLKPEDFYHPFHQSVFRVMEELYRSDEPIDEEFIKEKLEIKGEYDEALFVEILAATPLSNTAVAAYVKEIKEKAIKRQLNSIASLIKKDIESNENIEKIITNIHSKINNILDSYSYNIQNIIVKVNKNKRIERKIKELEELLKDDSLSLNEVKIINQEIEILKKRIIKDDSKDINELIDFFSQSSLSATDIEDSNLEYLIEPILEKQEITLVAGKPGAQKTFLALTLSRIVLEKNLINCVFYFDADNSLGTLKSRKVHKLQEKFGRRLQYKHISKMNKKEMLSFINLATKRDLTNTLFVFDSAKHFLEEGADRDKNKDVSKTMELFKELRKAGATIVLLHHTRKPTADLQELVYAGSSAWEEDSTNAFILYRNEHRKAIVLKAIKTRNSEINELAYRIREDELFYTLEKVDVNWAKEDKEFEEIKEEVIDYIKNTKEPTYTKILNYVLELGYSKNKIAQVLKDGEGRYWIREKLKQNNKSVFKLKVEEEVANAKNSNFNTNRSDKSYLQEFEVCLPTVKNSDKSYLLERSNKKDKEENESIEITASV